MSATIIDGKQILELDFPKTSLIVLVNRNNKYITPNGATELKSGDKLMIMINSGEEEHLVKHALAVE